MPVCTLPKELMSKGASLFAKLQGRLSISRSTLVNIASRPTISGTKSKALVLVSLVLLSVSILQICSWLRFSWYFLAPTCCRSGTIPQNRSTDAIRSSGRRNFGQLGSQYPSSAVRQKRCPSD